MPSCTITPLVTASNTAFAPQAAPTVEMSTPWSGSQVLGGSTTLSGASGNTNPSPGCSALSSASMASSRLTSLSDTGWALGSPTGSLGAVVAPTPAIGWTTCGCERTPTGATAAEAAAWWAVEIAVGAELEDPHPASATRRASAPM